MRVTCITLAAVETASGVSLYDATGSLIAKVATISGIADGGERDATSRAIVAVRRNRWANAMAKQAAMLQSRMASRAMNDSWPRKLDTLARLAYRRRVGHNGTNKISNQGLYLSEFTTETWKDAIKRLLRQGENRNRRCDNRWVDWCHNKVHNGLQRVGFLDWQKDNTE